MQFSEQEENSPGIVAHMQVQAKEGAKSPVNQSDQEYSQSKISQQDGYPASL